MIKVVYLAIAMMMLVTSHYTQGGGEEVTDEEVTRGAWKRNVSGGERGAVAARAAGERPGEGKGTSAAGRRLSQKVHLGFECASIDVHGVIFW